MTRHLHIAGAFAAATVLTGFGASWGIIQLLHAHEEAQLEYPDDVMQTVIVASRTLYPGVRIGSDDIYSIEVPVSQLPRIEVGKDEDPRDVLLFASRERVVGRIPRERILPREMVRPERLADGSRGVGLNALIPSGLRAISIDLQGADAITGFLDPGNFVDILVTMVPPGSDAEGAFRERTETILQAVMVVGVNSRAEGESEADAARRGRQRPSVTFIMTQSQAENLAFANRMGQVSLSLRNVLDVGYQPLNGVDLGDIVQQFRTPPPPQVVARVPRRATPISTVPREQHTFRLIQGSNVRDVTYDTDE